MIGTASAQQTITYTNGQTDTSGIVITSATSPTTLTIASGAATQSGAISDSGVFGGGNVIMSGTGTITLTATNTYSGTTLIDFGTLAVSGAGASISSSEDDYAGFSSGDNGTLLVSNGGQVTDYVGNIANGIGSNGTATVTGINGSTASTWSNSATLFVGSNGTGTLNIQNGGVVQVGGGTGTLTVAANTGSIGTLNIGNGGLAGTLQAGTVTGGSGTAQVNFGETDASYTFAPNLTGNLSVTQSGSGTSILTGNNTYTGATTISAGTLAIGAGGSIADSSGVNLAASGATFDISNGGSQTIQDLSGVSGSTVNLGGNELRAGTANSTEFDGVIQGSGGSLVKQGTGTLTLGGNNTYSGSYTSIEAGTLVATNNHAFSNTTVYVGNGNTTGIAAALLLGGSSGGVNVSNTVSVNPGTGTNRTVGGTNTSGTDTFSGLVQMDGSFGENRSMNVTAAAGGTVAFTNTISGSGQSVAKIGAGTVVFTGPNTYTGGTTINAGTLTIGSGGSIADSSGVNLAASGATFDISNGGNQTIQDLSGSGNVALGSNTLTLGTANSTTFSGVIADGGIGGGTGGGIDKAGTGTLTLTGANTYTGNTTIDSGTLAVSGAGASITSSPYSSNLFVGGPNGGSGNLLISNGGQITDLYGNVGSDGLATSAGIATVTGVNANGTRSTWTANGSLTVGGSGTGALSIQDGGEVISGDGDIGMPTFTGGGGTVTVSGVNANGLASTWSLTGTEGAGAGETLSIAFYNSGTLNVEDGGQVIDKYAYIGTSANSITNGVVNVTGVNANGTASTWENSVLLYVGYGAGDDNSASNATLTVSNGGVVNSPSVIVADLSKSNGTVNLDSSGVLETSSISEGSGNGAINFNGGILRATASNSNFISGFSSGEVTLQSGGGTIDNNGHNITIAAPIGGTGGLAAIGSGTTTLTAANTYAGVTIVSLGTLAVQGAGASISSPNSNVAIQENGTLLISNGGQVTDTTAFVGDGPGTNGTAMVTGVNGSTASTWNNTYLFLGVINSTGTLTVQNGGQVNDSIGYIGWSSSNANGVATVTGINGSKASTWNNSTELDVGYYGTGTLNVQDGGQVSDGTGYVGYNSGSSGAATVTGVNANGTASTWTNSGQLYVGTDGTGTLAVTAGGQVSDANGYLGVYGGITGSGTVTGVSSNGTASTWSSSSTMNVGYYGSSTGSLSIQDGGQVTDADAYLGYFGGATGSVLVSGINANGTRSNFNTSATLDVGLDGTGTLTVMDGGKVSDYLGSIGDQAGSNGTVTVSGVNANGTASAWSNSSELYVGNNGTGTLNVQNGGQVTDTNGYIGTQPGSNGTATVTGVSANGTASTWSNSASLIVGYLGTGTLNVQDGGSVSDGTQANLGLFSGSSGTATVTGVSASGTASAWSIGTDLYVGNNGTGNLTISDGGQVTDAYGHIGSNNNSNGAVTVTGVNANGTASTWTNTAGLRVADAGTGTLNIEDGGQVSSTNAFIGYGAGSSGAALITGLNANGTASNWINSGALVVGNYGTGSLTIENGGVVNSTSVILANINSAGGTVTLNSNGVLETGSLLNDFGAGGAAVNFNGGILRATANNSNFIANFSPGEVTLQSGGGTINNGGYAITVSTALGGSGGLTSTGSGTTILTGTNTYTGGTTISAGILQFAHTVAMPASETVSVNSGGTLAVDAGGTDEFTNGTSGYGTIGGLLSGLGGQSGSTVTLNSGSAVGIDTTDAGGSLTYSGNITNSGVGLTKLGTGTLVLTGTNTYTGATTVSGGTLDLDTTTGGFAITGKGTENTTVPDITVNSGGTLGFLANNQLAHTVTLVINSGGVVDLYAHSETLYEYQSNGGTIQSTGGRGRLTMTDPTYSGSGNVIGSGITTESPSFVFNSGSALTVQGDAGTGSGGGTMLLDGNGTGIVFNSGSSLVLNSDGNATAGGYFGPGNLAFGSAGNGSSGGTMLVTVNSGTTTDTISSGVALANKGLILLDGNNVTINTVAGGISTTSPGTPDLVISAVIADGTVDGTPTGTAASGGLTKTGGGILELNQVSTYSGGTTVSGGTLQTGVAGALGSTSGTLAVNGGGTLDLLGTSQTVGTVTLGTRGSTIQSTGGGATLNTGTVSVTDTGNSIASGATVNAGSNNVTISSSSALTLAVSGALSTTGTVMVNTGGSLIFGNGSSLVTNGLNTTANVTLSNGATLALNDASQTITGALTLTGSGSSEINLSGGGTVALSSLTAGAISGADHLVINGWTGSLTGSSGTIVSVSGMLALDATDLSNISWTNTTLTGYGSGSFTGATIYDNSGVYQLTPTPVPEPSTLFAAFCLLGLIGWRSRRQIKEWGFTLLQYGR
jgi:T5SS/PEP-CTERM-associated repeat protein/autotransporter-associated beta strand protein